MYETKKSLKTNKQQRNTRKNKGPAGGVRALFFILIFSKTIQWLAPGAGHGLRGRFFFNNSKISTVLSFPLRYPRFSMFFINFYI